MRILVVKMGVGVIMRGDVPSTNIPHVSSPQWKVVRMVVNKYPF
jgi:hypothetical protein